ncbi:MAG: hypothetical protein J1F35_02105 [Erysipelotrichales bacterium]|nr:hypothetical protein [Erysipelotrichales bacterium]
MNNKVYRDMLKVMCVMLANNNIGIPVNDLNQKIAIAMSMYFQGDPNIGLDYIFVNMNPQYRELVKSRNILTNQMFQAILVQDLYLKLNRESALDIISDSDRVFFKQILRAIEKNDFSLLLTNRMTINKFLDATFEFMDASAFLKVEMFKCLDEDDLELLSSFNPFFMDEYNTYNVEINQHFMIRQITKWINRFKDEERAINEAAKFLINAFKMFIDINGVYLDILNSNDPDSVNQAMIDEDLDRVAGYVRKYYDAYKQNKPKLT